MTTELILALMLFALVSSITPGPNNIMLMSSGATFGFYRTLPHMLGVALGFALMVALVGIGVMTLFDLFPLAYELLKWGSVAYLLYLAWRIAQSGSMEGSQSRAKPLSFVQAALFQWVNPKGWTMALTAISVYAPSRNLEAVLWVALVFMVVNLPSVGSWALMGQGLKGWLAQPKRLQRFNVTMAALLVMSLYPILL